MYEKLYRARSANVCIALILERCVQSKGYAVAQLVKALRYKPEGSRFDSRWCHCNFSLVFPSDHTMALGLT